MSHRSARRRIVSAVLATLVVGSGLTLLPYASADDPTPASSASSTVTPTASTAATTTAPSLEAAPASSTSTTTAPSATTSATATVSPTLPTDCVSINKKAAVRAAEWLSENDVTDYDMDGVLDGLIAFASVPGNETHVTELKEWVVANADDYVDDSPAVAAKIALALIISGTPASDETVTTILDNVEKQAGDDGRIGENPLAFGQALVIQAFARAGRDIPQSWIDGLYSFQGDNGAFGFFVGDSKEFTADADSTALALTALRAYETTPSPRTQKAIDWAVAQRHSAGYWGDYSPANTTGLMISALNDFGVDTSAASTWLAKAQLSDGGWPNSLGGEESNVMATAQAMLAVGTGSYLRTGIATLCPEPAVETVSPVPATGCLTVTDEDAATKAADWIATQELTNSTVGGALDALMAFASVPGYETQVAQLKDWVLANDADYASASAAAGAKTALGLLIAGVPADDDHIVAILDSVAAQADEDGLIGGKHAYAFGQALVLQAFARAGRSIPSTWIDGLYSFQGDEGAFGYFQGPRKTFKADPDTTALALSALRGYQATPSEKTQKAIDWAIEHQTDEGYWANYSPANTTGLMIPALREWGVDTTKATEWITGAQLESGAWSNTLTGTNDNLMATTQAILAVGTGSYLRVASNPVCSEADETAAPAPSTPAPVEPSVMPTPTVTPTPAATAQPTSTASADKPQASASSSAHPSSSQVTPQPTGTTKVVKTAKSLPATGVPGSFASLAAIGLIATAGMLTRRRTHR